MPLAYVLADTEQGECSDCGYYLGRWWEPTLVAFVAVWNYLVWLAGLLAGAAAARLRHRLRREAPAR